MADCKTIYYNSTTSSLNLGDFLYQNQAQTIPVSAGYYSWSETNKWYETDVEGVIIFSGSCPSFYSLETNYNVSDVNAACSESIQCIFVSSSYHLWYDFTNTASFAPPSGGVWQPQNCLELSLNTTVSQSVFSLAGTASKYAYNCGPSGSVTASSAFAYQGALVAVYGTNRQNVSGNIFVPKYTGSNSLSFTSSLSASQYQRGVVVASNLGPGFANSSDLFDLPPYTRLDILELDINNPFSFEVWHKTPSSSFGTGRRLSLISKKQSGDASSGYLLELNPSGSLGRFGVTLNNGSTASLDESQQLYVRSVNAFTSSDWQQIVVTYDGSKNASGLKLYQNGNQVSASSLGTSSIAGGNQFLGRNGISFQMGDLDYGEPTNTGDRSYVGRIGQVKIYKTAINAKTVLNNWYYYSGSFVN